MRNNQFVILTSDGRKYIKNARESFIGSQRMTMAHANIHQSTISDWESGRYNPSLSKFTEYLNFIKVNKSFLNHSRFCKDIIYLSPYNMSIVEFKIKTYNKYSNPSLSKIIILSATGRNKLKELRIMKFGSQTIAAKVNGIDQSAISCWETGKANPSLERLVSYLKSFDMHYKDFLDNINFVKYQDERTIDKMIRKASITNRKPISLEKDLTVEKSYILGVVGPGDGYVGKDEIQLVVIDKDFAEYFSFCIEKVYGVKIRLRFIKAKKPNHSNTYKVSLNRKSAVENLYKYTKFFKEYNWKMPKSIYDANEQIKCSYLRGIFDSQAHVSVSKYEIEVFLSNLKGLYEIQKLLKQIGIRSSVSLHTNRLRITSKHNLILYKNRINFIIRRKSKALDNLLARYRK